MNKPAPVIGRLRSGEWAVFNADPYTSLYHQTFATEWEAYQALAEFRRIKPGRVTSFKIMQPQLDDDPVLILSSTERAQ